YSANMAANFANTAANTMASGANSLANAMNTATNAMAANRSAVLQSYPSWEMNVYPYRSQAMLALAKQKDTQAVPALRRILLEVNGYEQGLVIADLLAFRGFLVAGQVDALEKGAYRGL